MRRAPTTLPLGVTTFARRVALHANDPRRCSGTPGKRLRCSCRDSACARGRNPKRVGIVACQIFSAKCCARGTKPALLYRPRLHLYAHVTRRRSAIATMTCLLLRNATDAKNEWLSSASMVFLILCAIRRRRWDAWRSADIELCTIGLVGT